MNKKKGLIKGYVRQMPCGWHGFIQVFDPKGDIEHDAMSPCCENESDASERVQSVAAKIKEIRTDYLLSIERKEPEMVVH